MDATPLDQLTCAAFTALVKTPFRVLLDLENSIELELAEVTPSRILTPAGAMRDTYENFALLFRGPADRALPQRTYAFESAVLGRFDLFIVPVGRDAGGMHYQATFNRVIKAT